MNQIVIDEPIRARARPCLVRPRRIPDPVGRADTVAEVLAALVSQPVQLHAFDGWGRTTILKHLAYQEAVDTWHDGVVFVSGFGRPVEDLEQDLFDAFFESVLPDTRVRVTPSQLRTCFAPIAAVLVIDDVDAAAQHVERLLDDASSCTFIFTSQERSLADVHTLQIGGLGDDDAVALFERRLGQPLGASETAALVRFARACRGQPRALVIAASAVRRGTLTLDALGTFTTVGQAVAALRNGLAPEELRALELLSSIDGAPLASGAIGAIADVGDSDAVLDGLRDDGLVLAASPRFRLPPETASALNLGYAREVAPRVATLSRLVQWAGSVSDPRELVAAGVAMVGLTEDLSEDAPGEVVALARAAHAGLAVTGQWGLWPRLLESAFTAARSAGDRFATAWALHELGTYALLCDEREVAAERLRDALSIREEIGDEAGAQVTRHNLGVLRGTSPPAPGSGGLPRWFWAMVAAVLIVAGAFLVYKLWIEPDGTEAAVKLSSETIDFGEVPVGEVRDAQISIANVGETVVDIRDVRVEAPFSAEHDCGRLEPAQGCQVHIVFDARSPGSYTAELVVAYADADADADTATASVSGDATETPDTSVPRPRIEVQPSVLDFGLVTMADDVVEHELVVSNSGDATAEDVSLSLEDGSRFSIASNECDSIEAGQSCRAAVSFTAGEPGEFTDVLHVDHGDDGRVDVPVRAVVPAPPDLVLEDASADDPVFIDADGFERWVVPITVTVRNVGGEPVTGSFELNLESAFRPGEWTSQPSGPTVDSIGDVVVDGTLDPNATTSVRIFGAFAIGSYRVGEGGVVRVEVDSCRGEEFVDVPPCRIAEGDEENNFSEEVPVAIGEVIVD